MSAPRLLIAGVVLAWVGCNSEIPSLRGVESESGLLVVSLPDASLLSAEQSESYGRRLASIEKDGEISGSDLASRFGELGKRMFADGFEEGVYITGKFIPDFAACVPGLIHFR